MPKRVSLKGKGADLFFDGYVPEASDTDGRADGDAPAQSTELSTAPDVDVPAGMPPRQHASMRATEPVTADLDDGQGPRQGPPENPTPRSRTERRGKQAGLHAGSRRRNQTPPDVDRTETDSEPIPVDVVLTAIWTDVCQPAPVTGSFRYTDRELSDLTDATYELSKRYGVKFSKQDVARLALNAVLWDYQAHGDESLLAGFVLRKKRQRGGH